MMFLMAIEDPIRRSKLELIYCLYKTDLYVTAFAMVKNHELAEDMVHTTIIRANDHIEKIMDTESKETRSYLITITKNLCRDYFNEDVVKGRHMKLSTPVDELVTLTDINSLVETNIIRLENVRELAKLINQIHPSYADILKLNFYDQNSIEEMSHILGITKNNVSVRLKRALMALKKLINERGDFNA